jgi:hypothetical protein
MPSDDAATRLGAAFDEVVELRVQLAVERDRILQELAERSSRRRWAARQAPSVPPGMGLGDGRMEA